MTAAASIMVADADPLARSFLSDNLTADGYAAVLVVADYAAIGAHPRWVRG